MNTNSAKKSITPKSNSQNKSQKRNLRGFQKDLETLKTEKNESKQIISQGLHRKHEGSFDILYLEGIKLETVICQIQEDLVKRKICSKDRDIKIAECTAQMAKFYDIQKNQISYSNKNEFRENSKKFIYTGFLVKKNPEGYGKLCGNGITYKGYFENGKKHDCCATFIYNDGQEKYIGGFKQDLFSGFGEQYKDINFQINKITR